MIQQKETTRDEFGGEVTTYRDLAAAWAHVQHQASGSDEKQLNDQQTAINRTLFTVRYTATIAGISIPDDNKPALTPERNRVLYEGRNYDILVISEIGRRQFLGILTEYRNR